MPREIVTVQVGQCGNQMGLKFWDVALNEYLAHPQYTDARDSLFLREANEKNNNNSNALRRPSDSLYKEANTNSSDHNNNNNKVAVDPHTLRARSVNIDMEEGVLNQIAKGPLNYLFDQHNFFISDVSGAGNNWAVGHMEYGDRYLDTITNAVRQQVECCDCIQAFFIFHSLSGGTGSGLGTRVLGMLEEEFPHVFRIAPVVMPSRVDDVVTAPYNSCFALKELVEHADCVFPLDNDALSRMVERAMKGEKRDTNANNMNRSNANYYGQNSYDRTLRGAAAPAYSKDRFNAAIPTATKGLPYDEMNSIVALMLSNLTSAMRFPGPLNFDINDVTTNLVPYPRLHLLTTAVAPLSSNARSAPGGSRLVDQMILSCLDRDHQLVDFNTYPTSNNNNNNNNNNNDVVTRNAFSDTCLATALLARGPQVTIGDMTRNIGKLKEKIKIPYWNEEGFKTALCGVSPIGHKDSVLMITNSCGIAGKVETMYSKFQKLYSVRSHVHHYEAYLSSSYFEHTAEEIHTMLDDYNYLNQSSQSVPKDLPRRMKDLVYY